MQLHKTLLSIGILAALGAAGNAMAQDAQQAQQQPARQAKAGDLDTITVTGIRGAKEKALDVKRDAKSHVEVVTAEDIGKLPDKNIADSLSHVPGVTVSSAGGNEGGFDENDRVSMRGTNPSLTQTLFNGHNIASGDWFILSQSGTVGRSVSYTLLPSELVNQVVVHKTSEASVVEGGVAGSVDIITRKPLEFSKPFTGSISLGAVHSSLPNKTDPQFSGLMSWKNKANNFGILVQAFAETRSLRRDGQEILGYEQIAPGSAVATAHPDLAGVWYPHLMGSALFEQRRKRTGGLIDVQFKPTDNLTLDLNAFSSNQKASNYNRNYMLWTTHIVNFGAGQAPDPGYVVRNGTLVSANFTGQPGTTYGVYDQISRPDARAKSNYVALDAKWDVSQKLTFKGQIGTSKGSGQTPTQDVAEWNTGIGVGGGYQLNGVGAADWHLNESPSKQTTALGWIFGDQHVDVRDKEDWGQIDGQYFIDRGAVSSLQFGIRQAKHSRSSFGVIGQGPGCIDSSGKVVPFDWSQANWCPVGTQSPNDPANIPLASGMYPGNYAGFGGNFPRNIWYLDVGQLRAYDRLTNRAADGSREDWPSEFALHEKSTAAYAQLNFESANWNANVGLRFVKTEENILNNVTADATTPGAVTASAFGPYLPVTVKHNYYDLLPSGNFKYNISKDLVLRVAASRTMTRPDYSALSGAVSFGGAQNPGDVGQGSGPNPDLRPIRSDNFDASLEWYFAPRALLAGSVFYMDLKDYIDFGQVTRQYKTFNNANPNGFMANYIITTPINANGKVHGFELSYEQPIGAYFGINANYTYADGKGPNGHALVGTSKNTYNLGGYFENQHFNAHVTYMVRSAFYSGLDRQTAFWQDKTAVLNASLGYKLNEHVAFSLDGLNLNNPKLKYYALNRDQPRSIYVNGRQYYFNVRFNF